jgi:hypothetical protein
MSLNSINPLIFERDTQCFLVASLLSGGRSHRFSTQHRLSPRRIFLRYRGNVLIDCRQAKTEHVHALEPGTSRMRRTKRNEQGLQPECESVQA